MNLKALVKEFDSVADCRLPLPEPLERISAWAILHGWDASTLETQRLLVRQALLDSALRQMQPDVAARMFSTPLQALGANAPAALLDAVSKAAELGRYFNFWGELYSTLIPQAARRRIGQFWTDEQIAAWMVGWLFQFKPRRLADIGCGAGNFLLKAGEYRANNNYATELYGCDTSPLLLNVSLANCWSPPTQWQARLPTLTVQDYLEGTLPYETDAVVCNPPYTRHHDIAPTLKDSLQAFFKWQFHVDVSRQGTLAFHFLLKLVAEMRDGARAAVIVPMEVLDARYGKIAKRVLCQHTTLTALIHFSPKMNAFHNVDVGASILLFSKGYAKGNHFAHLTLDALPKTDELLTALSQPQLETRNLGFGSLVTQAQDDLLESAKWFNISAPDNSRTTAESSGLIVPLKTLAKVVRGIATGANDFFALANAQVKQLGLESYVVRTIQRNREIQDIVLDEGHWQALAAEGKRVWLLYLNGAGAAKHTRLRQYLAEGEARGYHRRGLVQTRKQWYAMEQRDIPPIFFTILTRGNPRFILNQAEVRPLNMFSLIYPNQHVIRANAVELLWLLLNSQFSLSRLHSVSRTYGGNTLKVEPRELGNLPVVNPLALSPEHQTRIRDWIRDFYCHGQAAVLTRQVDGLVAELLTTNASAPRSSQLPIQPRLLEGGEGYKASRQLGIRE